MAEGQSGDPTNGRPVTITKVNERGERVFTYPGVVARALAAGVVIQASWTRPAMALEYATFEPGDQFTEWFYSDRWYNIMEVRDHAGGLKGWYCNVTWPAEITADAITYRDLILDLWVDPNGSAMPLDQDELAANTTLSADMRARAERALDEAWAHLARREEPFDRLDERQP